MKEVKEEEEVLVDKQTSEQEEIGPAHCSGPAELMRAGPSNANTHCF